MDTINPTLRDPHGAATRRGPVGRPGAGPLITLADRVLLWIDVVRQRRALQALDDRLLKDIGLTRADVEREASKPFWQA